MNHWLIAALLVSFPSAGAPRAVAAPFHASLRSFLETSEWRNFIDALVFFQRKQPGVFPPVELVRLDRLNEADLIRIARQHAQVWSALRGQKDGPARQEQEWKASRLANDAFYSLVSRARKTGSPEKGLTGTWRPVLDSIPTESRQGLTPLDPLFATTELGQKTRGDLAKVSADPNKAVDAVTIDEKNGRLSFENAEGRAIYELTVRAPEAANSRLRVRGTNPASREPMGNDLSVQKDFFRGGLFNGATPNALPLGAYPKPKEVWFDSQQNSHFEGDGHNHAGHNHAGHSH